MSDIYDEFAGLKRQIKAKEAELLVLQEESDELANRIIEDLLSKQKQHEDRTQYRITIVPQRVWQFSRQIEDMAEELDKSKKLFKSSHPDAYVVNDHHLRVTLRDLPGAESTHYGAIH